jgi:ferredoxin
MTEPDTRVRVFPGLCQGYGNCHRFAPRVYTLDDDGYLDVHLLGVPPELSVEARLGASVCPEGAIAVVEVAPAQLVEPER